MNMNTNIPHSAASANLAIAFMLLVLSTVFFAISWTKAAVIAVALTCVFFV